jgi:hypothetical protein
MARYFGVPLRNGLPIGLGSVIGLSGPVDPDFAADNIELEDGADLLLESGGLILLEGLMPTLWLDFQYSTSLDPRITFTRASTATYFNSSGVLTTAASGAARFTYNPSTLQPLGLLIEEARTNLFLQSQFASGWSFSNASFTSTTVAPDGTNTGRVLNDSSAAAAGYTFQGVSVTSGTAYVFSVFAKSVGLTSITLRNFTQAGAVAFNLTGSGSADTPTGTFSSPAITAVGNGWYRCSVIFTATGTASNNIAFVVNPIASTGEAFAIWGAQLEAGAFPTSYIPTTTTALTRNADVASMTGTNFSSWYNASQGTIVAEYVYSTTGVSNQCAYSLDNGTSSETIIMASTTPAIDRPLSSAGGVGQLTGGLGNYTFTAQQLIKRAVAYKLNDYGTSVNGGAAATDTTYTVPSPDRLTIGAAGYFSGSRLNGTIRRIAYYNTRLTNAQLQALTT